MKGARHPGAGRGPMRPWYREPWPWLLMAPVAIVVVAGIVTAILAVRTSDGVVADDYYKQGLGINRVIAREAHAQAAGLAARILFNDERTGVRVLLASAQQLPESLTLTLIHPTRRGEDQVVALRQAGPALYEGRLQAPRAASWRVSLEDASRTWRLKGRWLPAEASIAVGATD